MTAPHQVRLEQKAIGRWLIEIDGVDVADVVQRDSASLEIGDGQHLPVLSLGLQLWPGFGADIEAATVEVAGKARETLLQLGWTPPDEAPLTQPDDVTLNRLAQTFYEASGISLPRMTDKPLIVEGLRAVFAAMSTGEAGS